MSRQAWIRALSHWRSHDPVDQGLSLALIKYGNGCVKQYRRAPRLSQAWNPICLRQDLLWRRLHSYSGPSRSWNATTSRTYLTASGAGPEAIVAPHLPRRQAPFVIDKMLADLTFVTTPTSDTRGTCLILHVVDRRYVIGNVHEGLQRALLERGLKAMGISDVFLTGATEWEKLGGLMGFILSVSDVAKMSAEQARERAAAAQARLKSMPEEKITPSLRRQAVEDISKQRLTFHGGPNLTQLIATGRRFMFRKGFPLEVLEYHAEQDQTNADMLPSWQNDQIQVWAMPLARPANPEASIDTSSRKRENADVLQSIVREMFDSTWRRDELAETSLRDVKLPAAVFIRNTETHHLERYPDVVAEHPLSRPDVQVFVRKPWPGALIATLPPTQPQNCSMCYIIGMHTVRGKFLAHKAKELNVRPGPDFGKLTNGEPVLAKDGTTVLPEQVLEPPRPGRAFLVAELINKDQIELFLARRELANTSVTSGIVAAIWILGPGVVGDSRLQAFINEHSQWRHIISSPDHTANYLTYDGAAECQIQHHIIDPDRFSIPLYNNNPNPLPQSLAHCDIADRGRRIKLEPDINFEDSPAEPYLNTANTIESLPKDVDALAKAAQNGLEFKEFVPRKDLPGSENEIITLGTGSALPSKYRNVSATLLRVPGVGSYLLDCGENTLGQLARLYTPTELSEVLRDMKMIWISHMHADHHLGTASLIKAWYKAVHGDSNNSNTSNEPAAKSVSSTLASRIQQPGKLFVVAETAMIQWLREYASVENYGFDHVIGVDAFSRLRDGEPITELRWNSTKIGFQDVSPGIADAMRAATGLSDLLVCSVPHCHGARGVALCFKDGFKLTYSGDSRPSLNLVKIGQGSTVLLHEATFDDELKGDALAKRHSTTSEALGVATAMNAKRVVLTHFSQRYSRIPIMSDLSDKHIVLEGTDASNQELPSTMGNEMPDPTLAVQDSLEISSAPVLDPTASENPPERHLQPDAEVPIVVTPHQVRDMKVAVAFDYMRAKVKDIELLENFTPAFVELYKTSNDSLKVTAKEKEARQAKAKERKALAKEESRKKKRENQQQDSAAKRSKNLAEG